MTVTDRLFYYGFWGLAVGFALFYGWRIALPILAPIAVYVSRAFVTDTHFDPILVSTLSNLGLDLVAGLIVAIPLSILIRLLLKPVTMLFLLVPVTTLLGKSYWWLIGGYLDHSFYPDNAQLFMYVVGPLLVALCFAVSFRIIVLGPAK